MLWNEFFSLYYFILPLVCLLSYIEMGCGFQWGVIIMGVFKRVFLYAPLWNFFFLLFFKEGKFNGASFLGFSNGVF